MRTENQELFSPKLKKLEKDLEKIQRAEDYLEKEKVKLIKDKEKIRIKIRKEKEILKLKNKIEKVKDRKI